MKKHIKSSKKIRKQKLRVIYTVTICVLILSIISLIKLSLNSYALWYETNNQTTNNLISTGCFEISFYDLNGEEDTTSIGLLNTYPIPESVGVNLKPYTFTMKNICNIAGEYRITLSKLSNSTIDNGYLRYTFNKIDEALIVKAVPLESTTSLDKNTSEIISQKNSPNYVVENYVLEEGYINPGEELTYELRIWLDKSAGNDQMDRIFEGVVSVSSIANS